MTTKCPCTQECTDRTVGCRATCEAFQEYERQRLQGYKDKDAQREALTHYNSPSWKRLARYRHMQERGK